VSQPLLLQEFLLHLVLLEELLADIMWRLVCSRFNPIRSIRRADTLCPHKRHLRSICAHNIPKEMCVLVLEDSYIRIAKLIAFEKDSIKKPGLKIPKFLEQNVGQEIWRTLEDSII
jgi:hypothetical protein